MTPTDGSHRFIPTLNKTGWMLSEPDQVMLDFANCVLPSQLPCVDVGATYGVATIAALKKGKSIIATDIEVLHLNQLAENVDREVPELRQNLKIICGSFPLEPVLAPGSIGAVLLSRVITFLNPAQVRDAIETVSQWLVPGGWLFLSADSPFLKLYSKFLPEYQRRISCQEEWPGWIHDTSNYLRWLDQFISLMSKLWCAKFLSHRCRLVLLNIFLELNILRNCKLGVWKVSI